MPVRRHPVANATDEGPLLPVPVDGGLVDRLRSSYAAVRAEQDRLAEIFYAKLFAAAPGVRGMFNSEPRVQAKKLMLALDAIVSNLEAPEANGAMIAELGRRHATYGAKPEHYDLVVALLVESMGEVLGARASAESLEEWRLALRLVGERMIAAGESSKT